MAIHSVGVLGMSWDHPGRERRVCVRVPAPGRYSQPRLVRRALGHREARDRPLQGVYTLQHRLAQRARDDYLSSNTRMSSPSASAPTRPTVLGDPALGADLVAPTAAAT